MEAYIGPRSSQQSLRRVRDLVQNQPQTNARTMLWYIFISVALFPHGLPNFLMTLSHAACRLVSNIKIYRPWPGSHLNHHPTSAPLWHANPARAAEQKGFSWSISAAAYVPTARAPPRRYVLAARYADTERTAPPHGFACRKAAYAAGICARDGIATTVKPLAERCPSAARSECGGYLPVYPGCASARISRFWRVSASVRSET